MKVAILGSGSWGMGLASILQENVENVSVWSIEDDVIRSFAENRSLKYFPDFTFKPNVHVLADIAQTVLNADFIVLAIPVLYLRNVLSTHKDLLSSIPIISASKGIEQITGLLVSEVIQAVLPTQNTCGAISGPNLAQDIVNKMPSATSIACEDTLHPLMTKAFHTPWFIPELSTDIIGVQIGGALKMFLPY